MSTLIFVKRYLDRLLLAVCIVMLVLLVADVTWQVLSRYLMSSPSLFTDEAARFLMVWIAFLGGAYLFGKNGHLNVSLLQDKLPVRFKRILVVFSYLLTLSFSAIVMIFGSYRLILRTMSQPSPALGIPMGMFYSILPISAVIIILYMLLNLAEFVLSKGELPKQSGGSEQ